MRIHLRSRFEIHNSLPNRSTECTIGSITFELLLFISFLEKTSRSLKMIAFEKVNSYPSIGLADLWENWSDFSTVFGCFQPGSFRNNSITPVLLRRWPECSPISLTKRVQISPISEKFSDRNPGFKPGKTGFWFLNLAKMDSPWKFTPNLTFLGL